jgi:putative hemolysin
MIYGWIIVLALLITALFSAAEMSFIAANRLRLRHLAEEGNRNAARYLESFKQPERLLSTAMMGVTIAHITASSVATWALVPRVGGMAALLVTVVLTPLMLVFGEVIPKAVAREWATALILRLFRVVEIASKILAPLAWGANALVGAALRLAGRRRTSTRQFVSREELKLLLQLEPEEADVTSTEAEMIDKIFDLGETAVREVMVPLVDVAALPDSTPPDECIRLIAGRGFSRIPIYSDRIFNIVGVVTAMDLLRDGGAAADIRSLMRPATYVPETKRIDDLLRDMQKARVQLAVVVDEYGASVGIVTVEDIVEQVVGEIQDEHDRTPDIVERLPDGSYRVAGRARIDELNDALDWELPTGDFETVAGLVLATVHRIPLVGEVLHVGRYTMTVLEADSRRVLMVRITPPQADGGARRARMRPGATRVESPAQPPNGAGPGTADVP